MFFRKLEIDNWRQFERIDVELHDRLTVLTGANGAGKTTLLNIFAEHFGWSSPYLATPERTPQGPIRYLVGIFGRLLQRARLAASNEVTVGTLTYSSGGSTPLTVPATPGIQYHLQLPSREAIEGVHVSSHRELPRYQTVTSIPTSSVAPEDAYRYYNDLLVQRYKGEFTQYSPNYRLKESLIAMATFGAGNDYVQANPLLLKAYTGFIDVLKKVIPPSIGFLDLSIRPPEVVVVTESGSFVLDAASGGVLTLIDLAFRIHMFSLNRESFVVTIDEPENHLHPSMQRTLLPSLLLAFPNAQFIVATHSPFIISAVKDSVVYALKFQDQQGKTMEGEPSDPKQKRTVISVKLDTINKAGTAAAILRDVLGVEATMPDWVEADLNKLVAQLRDQPITDDLLDRIRKDVDQLGFSQLYPNVIARLIGNK